ncbi:hypothetical protein BJI69_06960 [Luteibacter rhizovicinus DSM 16549]|uniref:Uncharacterized protein n=1 Tax=Luteibacter rhizovicinus DSM 16549 TaxID=1440763 RepID=A0A0G9HHI1_9GAMM|nr:hypothetical protein [Luteibacter rhizovicinus]APG03669.1 hypothetical protein BJI69_06960 [Luteibacter rhizovicinus DSM 16549]KLD68619.1 hypothetical protein Y883_01065 [Luteibacter rhizovicinus DSM 16549]KLD75322.1 hypothetical protein Y886_27675 [Xanthomonas hyacinthi DSM 19077]
MAAFDAPFVARQAGRGYTKYEDTGCKSPCVERLWFENKLSLVEAWSIDIDREGRVVDKGRWVSP